MLRCFLAEFACLVATCSGNAPHSYIPLIFLIIDLFG